MSKRFLARLTAAFLVAAWVLPASALVIRHDVPTLDYENYGKDAKFDSGCITVRGDNTEYGIASLTAIDSRWGVAARHTIKDMQDYMDTGKTVKCRGRLWSKWNSTGLANRNVDRNFFFYDDFSQFANAIDIGVSKMTGPTSTLRIAPLYSASDEVGRVGSGASGANNRQDGHGADRKPENNSTSNSPRPYEVRWAGQNNIDDVSGQALGSPNNVILKIDLDDNTTGNNPLGTKTPLDLEYGIMNGDSGSPIYIDKNGVNGQIAGVVSGGTAPGYGSTATYVRISPYRTWITDTIKNNPDARTLTLAAIASKTVSVGQTVTVTNTATASDVPPLTLTFSLLSGPTGATLNASSGVFTWQPQGTNANSTNLIKLKVADNGLPSLSVTQSFTIFVTSGVDSDNDGLPDSWEMAYFTNLSRNGSGDFEYDGLSEAEEFTRGTNPKLADTDGDTYSDGWEVARGFDPLTAGVIYKWTAGGDTYSLYQEANWTKLGFTNTIPQINPNTPVGYDVLIESGGVGGGGFSASFDLGSHRLSMQGGTLRGQTSAGIQGTSAGRVRFGGGAAYIAFLAGVKAECAGCPTITFYSPTPFRTNSTLAILPGASPLLLVQGTTVSNLISQTLASISVDGVPALDGVNVQVTSVQATNVQVVRLGDTDGDGMDDPFEWQYGFNPTDPSDGNGDLDHDGTPNWLESRLGTAPNVVSPGIWVALSEISPGHATVQFGPGGTGLNYRAYWTPGLNQSWNLLGEITTGQSPEDFYEILHTNAPRGAAYYRIEVRDASAVGPRPPSITTNFFADFQSATPGDINAAEALDGGTAVGSWSFSSGPAGAISSAANHAAVFAHKSTAIIGMSNQLANAGVTVPAIYPANLVMDAGAGTRVFANLAAPGSFNGGSSTTVTFKWGSFGTGNSGNMKAQFVRGLDAANNELFELMYLSANNAPGATFAFYVRGAGDNSSTFTSAGSATPQGTVVPATAVSTSVDSVTVATPPTEMYQVGITLTNNQVGFTIVQSGIAGGEVSASGFSLNSAATSLARLEFSAIWNNSVASQNKGFWLDDVSVVTLTP